MSMEEVHKQHAEILDKSQSDEYVAVPDFDVPFSTVYWSVLTPMPRRRVFRIEEEEAALDLCAALNFGRKERKRRSIAPTYSPYLPAKLYSNR